MDRIQRAARTLAGEEQVAVSALDDSTVGGQLAEVDVREALGETAGGAD